MGRQDRRGGKGGGYLRVGGDVEGVEVGLDVEDAGEVGGGSALEAAAAGKVGGAGDEGPGLGDLGDGAGLGVGLAGTATGGLGAGGAGAVGVGLLDEDGDLAPGTQAIASHPRSRPGVERRTGSRGRHGRRI